MYHTRLSVTCDPLFSEILIAEISQAGFDSFLENENGFEAYAEVDRFDQNRVDEIKNKYSQVEPLSFSWDRIEKKNWNEEWEKSYEPIIVDDKCVIRAEFHQIEKDYPYSITITPKMSFGTGHHQTTYLMIKAQMAIDHKDKMVMDAGCGTAILSVMASKLGAKSVEAFDIDEWSVINGKENTEVNQCHNINIRQGMISELTFEDNYDIILANINKNILLQELPQYVAYLNPDGFILLSGFYEKDIPDLMARAHQYQLKHISSDVRENWASLLLQ
ncbi:MAG TPA: 50S ribosomal protein L11 methyltransferase, partial [Candidatus Gracilibacteria bacterium]|nr:50S ribosomal protein L11 methyltransferase [Candidatus Gracilibacteria bacterium]